MDSNRHQSKTAARIIVLTGKRGVGKSTVCWGAIALAQAKGYTCGGILTMSRPDGTRDLLDVHSGNVRRLTLDSDAEPAVIQGRFRFDPEALSWGNAALARAVPCDLLIVDEIGPLEIERGQGWLSAFDVLRGTDFALALVIVRPKLVAQAQFLLPSRATTTFTITPQNREHLPIILLEMLERETEWREVQDNKCSAPTGQPPNPRRAA